MADGAPPMDISPGHWRLIQDILSRHAPGYPVWAFGSRARGDAKPYSDLDLAIISDRPLPLATQAALIDAFSESDLPWRVDIADWSSLSDAFKTIVARDRVILTQDGDQQRA
jgi:type I restriction enzyme S subunit